MDTARLARPRRALGVLMVLGVVSWWLSVGAACALVGVYVVAALWAAGNAMTPSPTAAEELAAWMTAITVIAVVGAVLLLITVALEGILAVMALRRLREEQKTVPILMLVLIGVTTVLPVLLSAAAYAAYATARYDTACTLLGIVAALVLGLGSWARMAQLIGGILLLVVKPARI